MKNGWRIIRACIIPGIIIFLAGCAGYGHFRLQSGHDHRVTLERQQETWQDYHVYYDDFWSETYPGGLLFDPKNDEKKLIADKWKRVDDRTSLQQIIEAIEKYDPRIYEILDREGHLYGYLVLGHHNVHVVARVVDGNTIRVSDLQPRILGTP